MRASIDMLVEKLERQARRYRDKRRSRSSRSGGAAEPETIPVLADEEAPVIVKTKQFAVKPMTPEEAVLQLELIGHDFFVFQNVETTDVNVVYRRRDGNYGLIEPQLT
jgi:putative sigma-54 modulation protein